MSNARWRARHRRAHFNQLRDEFRAKRKNPEAIEALLRRIANSNDRAWAVAQSATGHDPLDDEERAMIAQVVAPHLAGMTRLSIYRRPESSPDALRTKRRNVLREIVGAVADSKEQERLYRETTGSSQAEFLHRKREVQSGRFDESDAA